jgi:selenocysteine-specific elongation factor
MSTISEVKHVLIGTAGHIDHGKTRLVGRLTNIQTDRLPEEKARGISIDLGFAHWETDGFQFGIVDVPGHERFVKNMVAGATGVNVALLVIAADDGVMPQTREHLEIMDLLGVNAGVIAVTKIDLVDPEFVELVQAEIEDLTAGTFLEGCAIVPVSSETGEGIDELKATLARVAGEIEWPEDDDLFRLPIDRVFSITGHGTVVTGSVLSGDVQAGDTLELLPECREVRVRSVQNHGIQADDSGARQRTAINLAGVKNDEVERGQELATPGYLRPTKRLLVELRSLPSSPITLKDRLLLSLHLGTKEAFARINFKGLQLKPGQTACAELRLKEPVVCAHGQRFILRRISPPLTVAGGTILDPYLAPQKRIKDLQAYGDALKTSPIERLSFLLSQRDSVDESPLEMAWRAGVRTTEYADFIGRLKSQGDLVPIGSRNVLVHRHRLAALAGSVMRTIRAELAKHQPRRALPRNTLNTACREITRPDLLDAIFQYLIKEKQLVAVGDNLGPADAQVQLTKNQALARTKLLEAIGQAGLTPPTTKELATSLGQKPDQLQALLNVCVEDGLLVQVSDALYFAPEALEQARVLTKEFLEQTGEATMSQLREAWNTSRKFAVPLCEYFDERGLTTRKGDLRTAGPNLERAIL